MHVLVAPVCSRFPHPKERGCLSGRTIFKPSVQGIYPRKSPFSPLFLVRAQNLSKLASWRSLSSLALHLMETRLIFPLFSLTKHFLAAEPKGTWLFLEPVSTCFIWKTSGRARLENNASEKSQGFFVLSDCNTSVHSGKYFTFAPGPGIFLIYMRIT